MREGFQDYLEIGMAEMMDLVGRYEVVIEPRFCPALPDDEGADCRGKL